MAAIFGNATKLTHGVEAFVSGHLWPQIGTSSNDDDDDDDGSKNVAKKMNLRSFNLIRLFGPAQYVKCRRLFLQLNSKGFYSGSKRGRKLRRRVSTSSIKRQIRRFHVVVCSGRQRNVPKSVMHVQSCCFDH